MKENEKPTEPADKNSSAPSQDKKEIKVLVTATDDQTNEDAKNNHSLNITIAEPAEPAEKPKSASKDTPKNTPQTNSKGPDNPKIQTGSKNQNNPKIQASSINQTDSKAQTSAQQTQTKPKDQTNSQKQPHSKDQFNSNNQPNHQHHPKNPTNQTKNHSSKALLPLTSSPKFIDSTTSPKSAHQYHVATKTNIIHHLHPSSKTRKQSDAQTNEPAQAFGFASFIKRETTSSGKKRFSKLQSSLIALGVALLVGLVGGLVLWITNRQETAYCTVQYESNGGSAVASEEIVCGKKATQPTDPVKDGFEFKSWILNGLTFNFDRDSITDDTILVAKWSALAGTEVITVYFDSAGGSEIAEREIAKGKAMTAPIPPTRSGYSFAGWYLNNKEFNFATPITESITLIAHWTRNVTPTKPTTTPSNSDKDKKEEEKKLTSLAANNLSLTVGESSDVTVTALPTAAKYELNVTSSDEKVATCSTENPAKNRLACRGIGEGIATIRITDSVSGQTTSFRIEIITHRIDPVSVIVTGIPTSLVVGDVAHLTAIVSPDNVSDPSVTWASGNSSVLRVNSNGRITAVGVGAADITATASNGITNSVRLTVQPKPEEPEDPEDPEPPVKPKPITSVTITGDARELEIGNADKTSVTLQYSYGPHDADAPQSVTWNSSDTLIATVDNSGKITAVSPGSTDITVTLTLTDGTTVTSNTIPITVRSAQPVEPDPDPDPTPTPDQPPSDPS